MFCAMEVTATQLYPRQLTHSLPIMTPVTLVGRISNLSESERKFTLEMDPEISNHVLTQMTAKLRWFYRIRLTFLSWWILSSLKSEEYLFLRKGLKCIPSQILDKISVFFYQIRSKNLQQCYDKSEKSRV